MDKTEKTAKKKKKSHIGFMVFILVAFVLCLVINYVVSFDNRLETMIVRSGSEEEMIETKGLIFRDQTLVYSSGEGYVYCVAGEDQRVKIGEPVVYIYKNEINAQANNELKRIEHEIQRLSENSNSGILMSSDATKIEQKISSTVRKVPEMGYKSDFEQLISVRHEVDALIEDKRIARGEIESEESSSTLDNLRKRKAEIEAQYDVDKMVVHSPATGTFTSKVDGLETALNLEALEQVSSDYIKDLLEKPADSQSTGVVKANAPVGKIVDNFEWYVAAIVPTQELEDIQPGDGVELRFTDISADAVDGIVVRIQDEEKGNSVVVLKSEKYVDMIYSTSIANIQIIKHRYDGYRVPVESLRMIDGKTGVYVVKTNKSRFVPVNILYRTKEWAIISEQIVSGESALKLYDELIISGRNLYDGKVVR